MSSGVRLECCISRSRWCKNGHSQGMCSIAARDARPAIHIGYREPRPAPTTCGVQAVGKTAEVASTRSYEEAPRFLLRDRDGIYGDYFKDRIESMGIDEVLTAPRSPLQNPFAERIIGSIRRECLNHVIVLGEVHLKRILTLYFAYYHDVRPHLSLNRNSPTPREVEPPCQGTVVSTPQVGGLHHRYSRAA